MNGREVTEVLLFDGFRLDRRAGGLFRLDEKAGTATPVALGSRALDLLTLLIRRNGEPVAKDEIMTVVWSGRAVEEANLNVQIAKLRHILDRGRAQGSCIQTITGYGYRFIAAVTPVEITTPRRPGSVADHASGKIAAEEAQPGSTKAAESIGAGHDPNGFAGDAHALLMSIYRDPRQPISLRIDAAKAALPFERRRLAAVEREGVDEFGDVVGPAMLPFHLAPKPGPQRHDHQPRRLSLAASR